LNAYLVSIPKVNYFVDFGHEGLETRPKPGGTPRFMAFFCVSTAGKTPKNTVLPGFRLK
jgi:hypothetical protein